MVFNYKLAKITVLLLILVAASIILITLGKQIGAGLVKCLGVLNRSRQATHK